MILSRHQTERLNLLEKKCVNHYLPEGKFPALLKIVRFNPICKNEIKQKQKTVSKYQFYQTSGKNIEKLVHTRKVHHRYQVRFRGNDLSTCRNDTKTSTKIFISASYILI